MKLKDILALAKLGYSREEIESMAAEESAPSNEPQVEPDAPASEPQNEPYAPANEPQVEPDAPANEPQEPIDYKALYEKSQEELKKAQAFNLKQSSSDDFQKNADDIVADAFRGFM